MENYKEEDLVLCTVDRIEGTTVFVKLPNGEEGSLVINEIAPGRIRNLREYVIPNKKIVCKILRVSPTSIDVSLRRVNAKEKKEVMDKYNQEHSSKSAFNQILKEKAKEIEEKIIKDFHSISDFFLKSKQDKELIKKYIPKEFHEALDKVIEKKQKQVEIQKLVDMKCFKEDGIKRIKKIFDLGEKNLEIIYLAAGKFKLKLKDDNYKIGNQRMINILGKIQSSAKQNACEIEIKDK